MVLLRMRLVLSPYELLAKLLEEGADLKQADKKGTTAFILVSQQGYTKVVTKLFERACCNLNF